MEDCIQKNIDEQAEKSKGDMFYGKPANDILNGRDCSVSAKSIRAIWEMVQNARDVSVSKSCNIVFIRKNGTFVFKHDGIPFTNDTLNALIFQTSAKSRNDGDQVGQYGTGFLTTHKFGREFHLAGSLKLVDSEELYYNFPELVIDRTPNTREKMAEKLKEQFEEKDSWREDTTKRSEKPDTRTVFTYLQPHEVERKNVEEAFEQAPELIPYVLCLNEGINSIILQDEIKHRTVTFTRGDKELLSETAKANLFSTQIKITDTENNFADKIMETIESKNTVTTKKGTQKEMVTVILPIQHNKVCQPSDKIARLFNYLPLVGTERWGINFILQAPMFTCSTDDRSSLRLITDGQTTDDPAAKNQEYIQEATDIIFEYIKEHVKEWQDVHYLAPIYFDVTNANPELNTYYNGLKSTWLQQMCALPIVNVSTEQGVIRKNPSEIYVLDATLSKAIKDDKELLQPFYHVLNHMFNAAVPCIDQLLYWSDVFAQWYEGESCAQIKSIRDIIEHIDENGLEAVSEENLLKICKYLKDSEQLSYFDKNILLTEDGTLTNKTEGYKSDNFGRIFKDSMKVLLSTHTSKFVKADFTNMVKLTIFSNKEVKDALSPCTEVLQTRIKTVRDAAKKAWETSTAVSTTEGILTLEERNALLNYCRMVIPSNSVAFQANAVKLICEYYEISSNISEMIDSDFFEWRGALRTLLSNVYTEFTLLREEEKNNKKDWIKRMVSCVYEYSEFKDMLQDYRVYLSQNGRFCYCKELKKDPEIPEKMKDIYNTIFSTTENTFEIRDNLFDNEFGKVAITDSTWEVIMFGNEIMDMIEKSGKYLDDIDTYEHKDMIMDIINYFENKNDGQLWKEAFGKIYKDIPSLLAKLVLNKDNREPMIKIMKVKDIMRLNKAAEIINDENLVGIWEMGKTAWAEKQNETHDFEKKKELGSYVEDYLRRELSEELSDNDLKADVDDQQGGQDIIVSLNGKPVYYIEVKSRWASDKSVMMSALQLDKSVEKKDQYSLFAVDMVGFNDENVKEHIYPATMEEFVDRIRVVTRIGEFNYDIQPKKRDPDEQVHIGGDYKAIVPQKLIEYNNINYQRFIDEVLKPKVKEAIKGNCPL